MISSNTPAGRDAIWLSLSLLHGRIPDYAALVSETQHEHTYKYKYKYTYTYTYSYTDPHTQICTYTINMRFKNKHTKTNKQNTSIRDPRAYRPRLISKHGAV